MKKSFSWRFEIFRAPTHLHALIRLFHTLFAAIARDLSVPSRRGDQAPTAGTRRTIEFRKNHKKSDLRLTFPHCRITLCHHWEKSNFLSLHVAFRKGKFHFGVIALLSLQ